MKLAHFKDIDFLPAIKALFKELNVPVNYVADEPTTTKTMTLSNSWMMFIS